MNKKETEDSEKKGKESSSDSEVKQKEKSEDVNSAQQSPSQPPSQGYQTTNQKPQPPHYQGANQMPQPSQYQGPNQFPQSPQQQGLQPAQYGYPQPLPYYQVYGSPYAPRMNDNEKQEKGKSTSQTDEQKFRNVQNFPYSPYPPPYPQHQVQSYGYPGTSQMQHNAPGYPPNLPYSQVVHVESPNQKSSPYRSGKDRKSYREPAPGYEGFTDTEIRRVFVRKVYLILMIQLLFTLGVIALFTFEQNTRQFVRQYYYIQFIAMAVFIGVYLGLACSGSMRRKYPTNIILLSIFTLAAAIMMGALSSYYRTNSVLIAVGICAAVCFTVTLFSFHTKFDFTTCGGILCILLLILVLFGIIAIFVREKVMTMIYAGFGAVVFTMYLAYDTQMLMGGKNVEISPEEYILAVIQLYIDVIYIFMFLLMFIGGVEK